MRLSFLNARPPSKCRLAFRHSLPTTRKMGGGANILRRAGEALYGERWQTPLSRDLGVTDRTIRNWAASRHDCPDDLSARLLGVLRTRGENMSHLISRLEQETNGTS